MSNLSIASLTKPAEQIRGHAVSTPPKSAQSGTDHLNLGTIEHSYADTRNQERIRQIIYKILEKPHQIGQARILPNSGSENSRSAPIDRLVVRTSEVREKAGNLVCPESRTTQYKVPESNRTDRFSNSQTTSKKDQLIQLLRQMQGSGTRKACAEEKETNISLKIRGLYGFDIVLTSSTRRGYLTKNGTELSSPRYAFNFSPQKITDSSIEEATKYAQLVFAGAIAEDQGISISDYELMVILENIRVDSLANERL